MSTDLERLAASWPDWRFRKSRGGRLYIATYRHWQSARTLLSNTARPDPTVIADSPQELADKLRAQPRGVVG
jgi:hypothetical protein